MSFSGRTAVSKTANGGSIPSTPAASYKLNVGCVNRQVMQNKSIYIIIVLTSVLIIGAVLYKLQNQKTNIINNPNQQSSEYNVQIDPANFTSQINNKYFTLKPGAKFSYENKTIEGLERIEIVVTNDTKDVMDVKTIVVWDRVWLDDELIEDTRDWYAQDKDGNVWYFGEAVDNYENGKILDHKGAWEAGVNGAKPGIVMKGSPKVGDSYRQEFYKGEAEDMGDVVALDKKVSVPFGTFENCLQTRDWSTLDNTLNEYKYYCPDVGFVTMEESVSGSEKIELVNVKF